MKQRKGGEERRVPRVVEALGEFVSEWRRLGNRVMIRPSVASFNLLIVRSPLPSLENPTRFECLIRTSAPLGSRSREAVSKQSCRLVSAGRLLKKLSFQPLLKREPSGSIAQPLLCEALNTDEDLISQLKEAGLEGVSITGYEGPLTEMSLSLSADREPATRRPLETLSVTWLITASKRIQRRTDFTGEVRATYRALDSLSYRLKDLTEKAVLW